MQWGSDCLVMRLASVQWVWKINLCVLSVYQEVKEPEGEGRTSRTPSESSDKDSRDGRYRDTQKFAQVRHSPSVLFWFLMFQGQERN